MTRSSSDHSGPRRNELAQALSDCRKTAWIAAGFSTVINLLILAPSLYMMQIYDRVLTTGHMETMLFLTAIAGVALLVMAALDSLRSAVMVRLGCWLNDRLGPVFLANSIVANLQGDNAGAQPLRDLAQIQNFMSTQGLTVFFDSPWLIAFVALIWILHPVLGMIALGTAILLLLLSIANELITRKANLQASVAQIAAMRQADAAVRNAEVVQAMGMLPAIIGRWQAVNGDSMAATSRAAERGGVIVGITKFVRFFAQVAILASGAYLVVRTNITPGSMIAASILMGRALAPVELALSAWRNFSATRIAYGRLKARLNNYNAEFDRIQLPPPQGNLAVENLVYRAHAGTILRGVSFDAKPGESIAIIGPSASGKSTLCRLIVGVLPVTAGQVRLDGSEIPHWHPEQLGRYIGYLPQDVELFAGTVKENIARMGPVDDAAVVSAAILAQAHDMIKCLSDGYDTQIGEGGLRLSGGQRQRIGLARALYGDPRLVVLDEPNANLDQVGEAALSTAIYSLKRRNVALIIVGHRPSTLATADKILLLREGQVEVFGPRDVALQKIRAAQSRSAGAVVPMQKAAAFASMAAMSEAPQGATSEVSQGKFDPHLNGGR